MKFLSEYRDADAVRQMLTQIEARLSRSWTLMEVCGGQTHAIVKYGLDQLLPEAIQLLHGPGCPVCVTPMEMIDAALLLAAREDVILCSFGDMLRVPGSTRDLRQVKAAGGDVRVVYSPLNALEIARDNPSRQVVFFAVGFETTAPAYAMALYRARQEGLTNFFLLLSQVLVPPALEALLQDPNCRVQGFLAAGHVCTIMGLQEYAPISERYKIPIVATGFEPLDILQGVYLCVDALEKGQPRVMNQYSRAVRPQGNPVAQQMLHQVFEVVPQRWRGLGEIPASGLGLCEGYRMYDALQHFELDVPTAIEAAECLSGEVLQGLKKPSECPAFGTRCTPEFPLGATMVSHEGACAAYYQYRGVV